MIYVILGMHKSGTTLVSQILHHSGINMGDDIDAITSYDQGNQYERKSTKEINKLIMRANGYHELNWRRVVSGSLTKDSSFAIKDNAATEGQLIRMKQVISDCQSRYTAWGFKDPRNCLIYPLWASELPRHKIIAIFRPYHEQWQRHQSKMIRQRYREPYQIYRFLDKWCRYNANILAYLRNTKMDFLVLNYQKLMTTDAEFDRLRNFVGLDLEDRRRKDLYRNRPRNSLLVKLAARVVHLQTGHHPEKIQKQLETLC
jgi:hypothetical protein